VVFRKKVYGSLDELQADLDVWLREYNEIATASGPWCFGKTPMRTFLDARATRWSARCRLWTRRGGR
jgi:hypothetical protein